MKSSISIEQDGKSIFFVAEVLDLSTNKQGPVTKRAERLAIKMRITHRYHHIHIFNAICVDSRSANLLTSSLHLPPCCFITTDHKKSRIKMPLDAVKTSGSFVT